MKLLICVVQDDDVDILMEEFVDKSFRVTKLSSTGGFLKKGNTTLFLGVDNDQINVALDIIRRNCSRRTTIAPMVNPGLDASIYTSLPVKVEVGGATVFQLDIDAMYRL